MPRFEASDGALMFTTNGQTVRIEPWGLDGLRVRATMASLERDDWPGALVPTDSTDAQTAIDGGKASFRNSMATVSVSLARKRGLVIW